MIYFDWRISTLQYCDGSLSYINMNWPQVCMCPPHPSPPSHLPPHHIPLGCPRAPALGPLLHASNLHWSFYLHMVIYMFQCYFLKTSHPWLIPLSPKVCSLHLCLLCCPACRSVTIFLIHIYALVYSICLSLSDLLHSV